MKLNYKHINIIIKCLIIKSFLDEKSTFLQQNVLL